MRANGFHHIVPDLITRPPASAGRSKRKRFAIEIDPSGRGQWAVLSRYHTARDRDQAFGRTFADKAGWPTRKRDD
jgi:hypothetical protein